MATALEERTDFEMKSSLTGNYSISEAEGIVECFVAAIGNRDHVGDIILPGAFTESLKRRKPRVVWGHDWNHPIGKVLECYEVGPEDPRLPEKMRKAGVGGLYARVQFNLKSDRGREAFHNIVFFGGEQEWSIGYKTREGEYDGRLQANLLKVLELFEMSPVLHGANSLTATISIKSAEAMMEEDDDDPDDETVSRGIAMLKSYCDENPEWAKEVNEKAQVEEMKWLNDEMETKVGPGNAGAIQDAIGGDLLRGRGPRRGNLEDLLDYWRPIMKKPGGFRRCLVILADHPELGPLPNLCAWLHHETTGKWPNEGNRGKRGGGVAKRVVMGKKDMDEVISNPASGPYGELAKALSDHFNTPVTILKANENEVLYRRDGDEEKLSYSVKYHSSEGSYFFATPEVLKLEEEKGGSCGCGGPCCKDEKSLESELLDLEEKAGRVLSSTNSEKIRQALGLLREVLAAGGVDEMETKEPVIRVKSGDPGLADALMVVGNFHGDSSSYVDGSIMEIEVKSEKHRMAVQNVLSAMHADFYDQGEVE